jgi:hypothetical protein
MKTFKQFCEAKENELKDLAKKVKIDLSNIPMKELEMGMEVEKEHDTKDTDVVDNKTTIMKIAVAHLREDPKYYTKLKRVENE